jgi:hypothetical protein
MSEESVSGSCALKALKYPGVARWDELGSLPSRGGCCVVRGGHCCLEEIRCGCLDDRCLIIAMRPRTLWLITGA